MTTVMNVYDLLQEKAPFETQLEFDNSGFLVGRGDHRVDRVLVALDITEEVVEEAILLGAQLIVAHHPVIWGSIKSLTDQTHIGRKLLHLAEHNIAAICAHTNLDAVADGVNDALAHKIGLTNIGQLHQDGMDYLGRPYGIGRVGTVSSVPLHDFAISVKNALGANGIRLVDSGKPVCKVAVGGGSCGSMLKDVAAQGCDTFVTADVKYDVFLEAKALGINLVDAGHYPTENVICPVFQRWINNAYPDIDVVISRCHKEVFSCL